MDHYDVLGVRPTAGHTEIVLAYKGRRSQYHPDRYSGQDADTLRWATERMQQVNTAYAVLSDPVQRRQYDASRWADDAGQAAGSYDSSTDTGQAGAAAAVSWRDFLADSVMPQLSTSALFCAPNIPVRRLQGALGAYGDGMNARDVTALLDDTLLGGGERGLLLTDKVLRLHSRAGSRAFELAEVTEIEAADRALVVNGIPQPPFSRKVGSELGCLAATLNDFLVCSRRVAPSVGQRPIDAKDAYHVRSICHAHMGPASFSGAGSCAIGPEIPAGALRLVRFVLGLPPGEEVLAWSNLALHGHANAFVVTTHGVHSKVGSKRSFVWWEAMRHLQVTDEFEEGLRCGFVLSDGSRVLCSRLRGDGQTFGGALARSLASFIAR